MPDKVRQLLAFINERFAVGAFTFGRIVFMGSYFDSVKAAAVAVFAVMNAVVDITSNVSVSFHNQIPPIRFVIILCLFF